MDDKIILLADLFEEILTPHQGEVFKLCREGWTNSQIAHKMNISYNAVKQLKKRIKKRINKMYNLKI